MNTIVKFVPRVGDIVVLRDGHPHKAEEQYYGVRRWRVTGYLKSCELPKRPPSTFSDVLQNILDEGCRKFNFGKGETRVKSCSQYDAEYISGSGISGCVYPIEDVIVIDRVKWNKHYLAHEQLQSLWRLGEMLF